MGIDLLHRKRIRFLLLKKGILHYFRNRPNRSDSTSCVIHSWIKSWRLYEKNENPFSLKVNLARFRDILQLTTTTDVQTTFSYLTALAGKSTDKVNSGFEMWCREIRNWNAGLYKKHRAVLWKTHSCSSSEYSKKSLHCWNNAVLSAMCQRSRTELIVFTDERVINEGIGGKGHKTFEMNIRNQSI